MAIAGGPNHGFGGDGGAAPLLAPDPRRGGNFPASAKQRAYRFDGRGNYHTIDWNLSEGAGGEFNWYHVELPKGNNQLAVAAQYLIEVLCPPLCLHDILNLVSNGPYVGHADGALVFRVNSPGPAMSDFTIRLAARVTENSIITVSLGRVPRLGFSPAGQSLLSEIPSVKEEKANAGATVIPEHVLEFLLTMNHSEEGDNSVPNTVSNLLVHIIDTHVDQVQDIVTKMEMELDSVELDLDKGDSIFKKKMLDDKRFSKMHLNLQRLLQVVSYCEQVFPRVKEKCASKSWFSSEDIVSLEELIGRLRRIKENLGFLVNRVMAVQAGLDSWQSEQINRRLYYLSFLSMIFLPLSVVTGVFGMNVGGVPWTKQAGPGIDNGFLNVLIICALLILLLLLCFTFPSLYHRFTVWRTQLLNKSKYFNKRPSFRRSVPNYVRI